MNKINFKKLLALAFLISSCYGEIALAQNVKKEIIIALPSWVVRIAGDNELIRCESGSIPNDLNQDGFKDIVILEQSCGSAGCSASLATIVTERGNGGLLGAFEIGEINTICDFNNDGNYEFEVGDTNEWVYMWAENEKQYVRGRRFDCSYIEETGHPNCKLEKGAPQ
jgi:hypothetical protein